ncbi:MAG: hypothetical protein D6732_05865 [Methanobacteriota archaeon]|nr:MAG: hypothetical protein D6732_05865 [Euryarchaeota archaeon]
MSVFQTKYQHYFPNGLFMNFLENHDEPRAVTIFGKEHVQPFASFIFTLPGIPLLLMGQEFADTSYNSWRSLFEKEPIDWAHFDTSLYRMYKKLVELRHWFPFNDARFDVLMVNNQEKLLMYSLHHKNKSVVVTLNLSAEEQQVEFAGFAEKVPYLKGKYQDWFKGGPLTLDKGRFIHMKPYNATILVKEN